MALVNLETYYSFPNLSDENNVFRYSPGFFEVGRGDEDDSTQNYLHVKIIYTLKPKHFGKDSDISEESFNNLFKKLADINHAEFVAENFGVESTHG